MVPPERAAVVIIPFPFSDLSGTKLRPAVVLAAAGRGDWLLCQITSNPYSDPYAIRLTGADMRQGGLRDISFARPLKVFTASEEMIVKRVAQIREEPFDAIIDVLVRALQGHTAEA